MGFFNVRGGGTTTINGSTVTGSVTNGYITINGTPVKVYDESILASSLSAKATIDDISSSINKTYSSSKINTLLTNKSNIGDSYTKSESQNNFASKSSEHTHSNKTSLDRLGVNSNNNLTIDGVEKIGGTSNGNTTITDSATNGNITVNGSEIVVYDDTNIKNTISNKADKTSLNLSGLGDVDVTNKTNGYALQYDSVVGKFVSKALPSGSGTGATSMSGLSDVDVTTTAPETNDVLTYQNGVWIPKAQVSNGSQQASYVVKASWVTSGTYTFGSNMHKLYIYNSGDSDLTFTIGDITVTVKPTEQFEDIFDAFTSVTINATSTFNAIASSLSIGSPNPEYSTKYSFTDSKNTLRGFSGSVYGVVISNDGTSDLSYTINSITLHVKAGEVSERYFDAFTSMSIDATSNYRCYVKSNYGISITGSVIDTTPPNNVTNLSTNSVTATSLTLSWTASNSADISSYDIYQDSTLLGNTTLTSYDISGLTEKTQYTFVVKSKDGSGNVSTGSSVVVTTPVAVPNNVTNLTTSILNSYDLTLSWTAVSNATSYDVYNGSTLLGNTTNTTYPVSGLSQNSPYTFKVISKNSSGSSTGSTLAITTPQDVTPPNPVTSLQAGTVTNTTIPISWTLPSNSDVANIEVGHSSDSGATYTIDSAVVNSSSTSYTVSGLNGNTSYVIRVVVIDKAGNRSTPSTIAVSTLATDTTPPNDVTNLQATSITQTGATLTWTASNSIDITSYDIYNGSTLIQNVSTTSYSINGLTSLTQYTFTVKAKDASGNASTGVSTTFTTTAFTESTNFSVRAGTLASTSLTLVWNGVSGATGYQVYINGNLYNGTPVSTGVGNGYTEDITGLTAGTVYTFKLVTVYPSGSSNGISFQEATYPSTIYTSDIVDSFNRADQSILGITDSGHYWYYPTQIGNNSSGSRSNLAIGSNQVYNKGGANLTSQSNVATNTHSDNLRVYADFTAYKASMPTNPAIIFRMSDNNNFWMFYRSYGSLAIRKVVSSTNTDIGTYSYSFTGIALPHTAYVELRGSYIYCYFNGALIFAINDSFNQNGQYHGIQLGDAEGRLDNFKVQDVSGLTAPTPDSTAPTEVASVTTSNPATGQIKVSWTGHTDTYSYDIYVNGSLNKTVYQVMSSPLANSSQNYTITGLTTGTSYDIKVVAKDGFGNTTAGVTVSATAT